MVCDARTGFLALLRDREFEPTAKHLYFFLSYFFNFSYFFCTRQFSAFNSFTFLYISDVKIVKFNIFIYVGTAYWQLRKSQNAALYIAGNGKIVMGVTLNAQDAPVLHNTIMSFLWPIKKAKIKKHHLMCSDKHDYTDRMKNWSQKCLKYLPQFCC